MTQSFTMGLKSTNKIFHGLNFLHLIHETQSKFTQLIYNVNSEHLLKNPYTSLPNSIHEYKYSSERMSSICQS